MKNVNEIPSIGAVRNIREVCPDSPLRGGVGNLSSAVRVCCTRSKHFDTGVSALPWSRLRLETPCQYRVLGLRSLSVKDIVSTVC